MSRLTDTLKTKGTFHPSSRKPFLQVASYKWQSSVSPQPIGQCRAADHSLHFSVMRITNLSLVTVLTAALAVGCSSAGDDAPPTTEQALPETTASAETTSSSATTSATATSSTRSADNDQKDYKSLADGMVNPNDPTSVYDGVTISDFFSALNFIDGYQSEEIEIDSETNIVTGKYNHLELPTIAQVKAYVPRDSGEPHPLENVNDPHMQFFLGQVHSMMTESGFTPVEEVVNTPNFEWKCVTPEDVPMNETNNTACFTVLAGRVIEVQNKVVQEDVEMVGPADNLLNLLDNNLAPLKELQSGDA